MKIQLFVSLASSVFAAWLGVTFIHELSEDDYRPDDNLGSSASAEITPAAPVLSEPLVESETVMVME